MFFAEGRFPLGSAGDDRLVLRAEDVEEEPIVGAGHADAIGLRAEESLGREGEALATPSATATMTKATAASAWMISLAEPAG